MAELWPLRVEARVSGVILRRRFWFVLAGEREEGIVGETYDAVECVEHIESVVFGWLERDMLERRFRGEREGGEVKRLAQQYIPLCWDHNIVYILGPKSETLLLQ
jgi:hypothetical protein